MKLPQSFLCGNLYAIFSRYFLTFFKFFCKKCVGEKFFETKRTFFRLISWKV